MKVDSIYWNIRHLIPSFVLQFLQGLLQELNDKFNFLGLVVFRSSTALRKWPFTTR